VLLLLVAVCGASGRMIDLLASAEVENVARISVPEDHTFFLKLQCTTCRSDFPNAVGVSSDMVVEGIRGKAPLRPACLQRPAPAPRIPDALVATYRRVFCSGAYCSNTAC